MAKRHRILVGSSLILFAMLACNLSRSGPETPTARPAEAGETAQPAEAGWSPAPTNTDGAETVLIPGGMFWMGSEDNDPQAEADEAPRHQVTLGAFPIYTHEVTNGMYAACVEAGACILVEALAGGPTSQYGDPAFADFPVTGVDWLMARDYCGWAGGRLPSEAEWELASRSIDSLRFPWGDEDPTCDRVNMLGCNVPPDTLAVGSLANGNSAYDAWDMSGNVWEWLHDWYDKDYYFLSPAENPVGPNVGEEGMKIVHGGGLYSAPEKMRSAERQPADPHRPYDDVGFRCVALPAAELPSGYASVDPGHLRVPPDPLEGGGEHVEDFDPDPDIYFELLSIVPTCPIGDEINVDFTIFGSSTLDLTSTVDGVEYRCAHMGAESYLCKGPIPAAYGGSGRVTVGWCVEGEGISACGAWPARLPSPADCAAGGPARPDVEGRVDCPAGGLVHFTFDFTSAINWTSTQLMAGSDAIDLDCAPTSDTQMICTGPDRSWMGHYWVDLRGTSEDGTDLTFFGRLPVPVDCPMVGSIVAVNPICYGDLPSAQVLYEPPGLTLESATADGSALACIGIGPSVQICGDLPGVAGSATTVTTCFEGEPRCQDWPLTVPACPSGGTGIGFRMAPGCLPGVGPVVSIFYSPADQPLVSASADGTDLACSAFDPTAALYGCRGIPGTAGSDVTVTFCLADGSCYSGVITVADCGEEVPSETAWRLVDAGCHGEDQIFFMVDTDLAWLVPGADFTYYALDEVTNYSCSIVPSVAGRLYCSSPRPEGPGPLEVCVRQEGAPAASCSTFPDWPAREDGIRDCAPPPEPVDACSVWTSSGPGECIKHLPCQWISGACRTP